MFSSTLTNTMSNIPLYFSRRRKLILLWPNNESIIGERRDGKILKGLCGRGYEKKRNGRSRLGEEIGVEIN